jgi:CBS domain-containing protein
MEAGDGLVDEPYHIEDIIKDLPVTWEDFNQGFHAVTPEFSTIESSLENVKDYVLDLRPYMEHRPHTVEPEDTLQKILDTFRLNNLRYMPVVKNQKPVGIICR